MTDREAVRITVYKCIAETFNYPLENLREDLTAPDIPGWDSISTSYLVLNLEEAMGRELDIEKILETDNVGQMVAVIAEN